MTILAACGGGDAPQTPQPVSLTITGVPILAMTPGQSAQLTATLTYSDSSTQDVTLTAKWSTTDANVLSVSSSGTIVAIAPGQADVAASTQGLSGRSSASVAQPPAPRLALFAGSLGGSGYVDGLGAAARFSGPTGIAIDSAGTIYVADAGNSVIRKIAPNGAVTTLAGTPGSPGSADGVGPDARFSRPDGVAVDSSGNVYVADTANHAIRMITPAGVVSTLAGVAGVPGSADGTVVEARFNAPQGVAVDSAGNVYVADTQNFTIRRITPAGTVATIAGAALVAGNVDGLAAQARFGRCDPHVYDPGQTCYGPGAIAVDGGGNLYVADTGNLSIRHIGSSGEVSSLPGTFSGCATSIFPPIQTCIGPTGVAADSRGNVYVAVATARLAYRIAPSGTVAELSGAFEDTGWLGQYFARAGGVAVDDAGNVYVPDTRNHTIRRTSNAGVASTLAGSALLYGSSDGAAEDARFGGCNSVYSWWECMGTTSVAVDGAGNVYVADRGNHTIRKITPAGTVSTLAGLAGRVGSADGAGSSARFDLPTGVAADGAGSVYVADSDNNTVRKITAAGTVTTIAGEAGASGSSDGTGAQARFSGPNGIAIDSAGNVYVADARNSTIRRITPAGAVSTLAGEASQRGSADGIGAQARFDLRSSGVQWWGASGLATDGIGNLYVADTNNHTIRKITAEGVVSTLAGSAGQRGDIDGIGNAARFNLPQGVATDSSGNVYVADTGNAVIRKITPGGVVSTVVGVAGRSAFVAGSLPGGLTFPQGLAVSGTSLYVALANGVAVVTNLP